MFLSLELKYGSRGRGIDYVRIAIFADCFIATFE